MKLNKAEQVILLLSAVILALMAGWALGARHSRRALQAAEPAAVSSPEASVSPEVSAAPAVSAAPSAEPAPAAAATPAAPSGELLDLNAATLEELMALPNIGEVKARAILDWRAEHGPFQYPEDLIQVPGIGEKTVENILEYVTVKGN